MKKVLLSIAGYDPSGGAGILLDLKVFQHMNFHGLGILTSLTVQNTQNIKKIHYLPTSLIKEQFFSLAEDFQLHGIKIGMVARRENIQVINDILSKVQDIPKVVDPVFKSSSGTWLLEKESIPEYLNMLRGKVNIITPNLEEAGLICRRHIGNLKGMQNAAEKIFTQYRLPCLVKGGHLPNLNVNVLFDGKKIHIFEKIRFNKSVHGTGCFLASSILCFLTEKLPLHQACQKALNITHKAVKEATSIGKGQSIIIFNSNH